MINQEIIGAPCKHGHIPFSCDRCTIEHLQEELATLKASLPKIKADAVLSLIEAIEGAIDNDFISLKEVEEMHLEDFCELAKRHANQLNPPKIESTPENWENRLLGADESYVAVSDTNKLEAGE